MITGWKGRKQEKQKKTEMRDKEMKGTSCETRDERDFL